MAIESPSFEVVKKYPDFEVRRYASYVVAETEVGGDRQEAGNEAFGRLGGYIFGANTGASRIAMTSPVTQAEQVAPSTRIEMTSPVTQTAAAGNRWTVQFSMPKAFTLETLPRPKDARVTLRTVPSRVVAVLRYSGTWSEENFQEHLKALEAGVTREGLTRTAAAPTWARYDPPYTPWFMRTNEVFLELAP